MSDRLEGKVALVTGAAKGIGEAITRRFVKEGAKVTLADIDDGAGQALADELGDSAHYVSLDVAEIDQWDAAVADTVGRFGGLDILVNNAGFGFLGPLDTVDLDAHLRLTAVNQHGVFYGMRAARSALIASGAGSIVNMSSMDGIIGVRGMTTYVATKFAVRGMTKSVALELGPLGVRVNSVHPGMIDTPLMRGESKAEKGAKKPSPARRSTTWSRCSRSSGSVDQRRSPTWCCSWPRTRPRTAPGPSSSWMADTRQDPGASRCP